ncbi:MAG: PT domain-containing protein [Bacteroidetes bacterium]|nr:PT domain-containing protein [Bacteroidota bacterium]
MKEILRTVILRLNFFLFMTCFLGVLAVKVHAQNEWPRKIENNNGTVTIYQPQLESLTNDILEARAAVSVKTNEIKSPLFGAMWFSCRISTDRDERLVTLIDIRVTASKFPDIDQENIDELNAFVETEVPKWELVMSLDQLLASLEINETALKQSEGLNNEPPEIIYTMKPSVLVYIDGEPIMEDTDEPGYQYVVNTPFFIVKDVKAENFYIKGGNYWYTSVDIRKDWKNIEKPPKQIKTLAEKAITEEEGDDTENEKEENPVVPELFIRTTPAELLMVDGDPDYAPIEGTSLLYMTNTDSDVLMDINSQFYYLLIAGRWYQSASLDANDWKFIKPDEVPDDFARIPSGSEMAGVKASVAGTQEAKDAVIENQIPQTAEVSISEATLEVDYDGKPKFEVIEGTSIKYAVNTDKSVLQIGAKYYCCDNAVWFEADDPNGPWQVSVSVPSDVQDIPPESPVYNVKYVYVYDYTPQVVYVGYTPGYVHSYVYRGAVYYGTGYYYRPWYGAYYYPRPVTYGFGVHYNPWTGWGFSMTVSNGWMTVGYHSHAYGYWGPAGYRPGYHHGYHRGYQQGARAGYRAGYYAGQNRGNNNIYRNRTNGVKRTGGDRVNSRPANPKGPDRSTRIENRNVSTKAKGKNNVYTDRDGNVYRQDKSGWQKQENGKWNEVSREKPPSRASQGPSQKPAQQPTQRPSQQPSNRPATRPAQQTSNRAGSSKNQSTRMEGLNRDAKARNYGSQRTQNYNQSRSNQGVNRSGAGSRPGGGRPAGGRR